MKNLILIAWLLLFPGWSFGGQEAELETSIKLLHPRTITAEAGKSIQAKVIELLETSNFNSKDHPGDVFRGGVRGVHRKYRATIGGQYLVVSFPEPRQFDLIRGQATAIEVVVGLNHPEYADALFTIDAEGRIVEHSKFSGKDATELLELVKSEGVPRSHRDRFLSWEEAVEVIRSGEVVKVGQSHSLDVDLRTRDGGYYFTREPRIDEVIRVVREQAPNTDEISIVTE